MTSQTWPQGGYAPGSYWCKCVSCDQQFTGDKRAYQCPDCIIQALTVERDALREGEARLSLLLNERAQEWAEASAERDALRAAITEIKTAWDWWQADSHDRCSSVVSNAIDDAMNNSTPPQETAV